jgi:branched-chain amino acid transport system ATP-binding protein
MAREPRVTALLEAREVHVDFGGVRALDGVSIAVAEGALCGLIGPNGSGKSTLLGVISRLTRMTAGSLVLAGEEYTRVPPHAASSLGIARTFQTVRLLPGTTVLANVMLGAGVGTVQGSTVTNWLYLPRVRAAERRARADAAEALERVGMAEHARDYALDLPYGKQRKVEIARALACRPRVLLLDEPTAGMSRAERSEVGDLLLELKAGGLTQILVEHDLAMIHRVCDTGYALNFGKVIASGTPAAVAADEGVREAYVGRRRERPRVPTP